MIKKGCAFIIEFKLVEFRLRYWEQINELNKLERWQELVESKDNYKKSLENSITIVAVDKCDNVIGFVRGLTDGYTTLFICELLIIEHKRGRGIGNELINHLHKMYPDTRIDLLATNRSAKFYEKQGFRNFYGYRKNF
ncbi:N-acetyltransferase [Staphylococcus cohnii]|nr:GNAT family N-acetyltransferase [Staphylococcus cohnii]RIL86573.1 N-acetyltransferase [Staphylococcus cohnii]